jgi:protein pelota
MKAERGELQRSCGEIRLFPESIDDLWHLEHLVGPGDLVFATTLRTVEGETDKIRPEKLEKKPVRLGIRVERVEFHKYALRLRLTGMIEQGFEAGSYHTLNIEPGYELSVIKCWRPVDLERIERAIQASVQEVPHILTIEEGEAELFRIRQFGPEGVVTITSGSGKEDDSGGRADFFSRVADHLKEVRGPLIVAGPGFVKDDLMKYLRSSNPDLAARVMVIETRRIGRGAVQEAIGQGVLERVYQDLQLGREVRCMEDLLQRIACSQPAAYGKAEVSRAVEYGAVEQLFVADSLLRDPDTQHLIERAELLGSGIVVFSTEFEPGAQLESLGGVAALLRYRIE